ncbi:uncharacterized protein [Linepithema humile]|uniref:uncharacterized protein n=1 Tax=Linepithema humile TaxID=83485 RepID=UPI00351E0464
MDPETIPIVQLKAELQRRSLSTAGKKAELIARLNKDDPSGKWIENIVHKRILDTVSDEAAADEGESRHVNQEESEQSLSREKVSGSGSDRVRADQSDIEDLEQRYRSMELEFERRENELLRRELELER